MSGPSGLAGRLAGHVEALAGSIGERNVWRPGTLDAAAGYITRAWEEMGHGVQRHAYDARGETCENLEVVLTGSTQPSRSVIVGAHYDTVPGSPGADDNASGVAALLEIGRALRGLRTERTIRLVAFVNEEAPFFFSGDMGSRVYATAARRRGDDIDLMISLEMLGYYDDTPGSQRYPPLLRHFFPDRGDFIAFVSNLRSRASLRRAVTAFRRHSDFPVEQLATFSFVPGVALSDHLSFWRSGYHALMVTDTAWYRNRFYHTPGDTPDRLDYSAFARVTAGLSGTVADLAGRRP
jgi:Zn-dependent M28 family amino/carboxypeptidase